MKIRITSCVLLLAMLLVSVAGSLSVFAENAPSESADSVTAAGEAAKKIVSDTIDAYSALSISGPSGYAGHGNHQTRILYTDSGVYMTCPGKEGSEAGTAIMGMWKINEDGSLRMLVEYETKGMSAGTTSQVMADAAGNVWVVSSWDEGSGFYRLHAWKYDPKADEVSHFEERGYAKRGSMWGKPVAIMDAKLNRIYVTACGNSTKTGYLMWTTFDITTETWNKDMKVVNIDTRADYHYGYPDGNGGFYTVAEICPNLYQAWTDIEGMNVKQAIEKFRSRKLNADYVWMEPHMFYVPNADVSIKDAVAYDVTVKAAEFDVENGCYPNVYNCSNDLFLDEERGLLYLIVTMDDSGSYGRATHLFVYDARKVNDNVAEDGVFPLVAETTLSFALGNTASYTQHFFKDTEGNLYIIALPEETGLVEIWKAKDNTLATEFTLAYAEPFKGVLNLESGKGVYGTIIATNRNNSLMTDVAHLTSHINGVWYAYTVDFEALRTYLANK